MSQSPQPVREGSHNGEFANYHPRHHGPHAATEQRPLPCVEAGTLNTAHGAVDPLAPQQLAGLRQREPERKATGIGAVLSSFHYALGEAGVVRGVLPLLQVNQKDGFDCPGCAWPDPDGKRSHFDFCENGAKAVAHESDRRRVTADFFAKHSVAELSQQSDYWLEQQGRLTEPMVLRTGATHYQPISWADAFALIADELNALASPNEASFYTSGKATNEAAFAYQLFVRQFGTNNLPDCSNMCHEASGTALNHVLGFGKGTVKLEDIARAKLIFNVGHNPGTNHPRMLSVLQEAKRNGAKIVAVNPLPETGLISFMQPQEVTGLLGHATPIADLFLQVRINGDVPLFKGILKAIVAADDAERGAGIDWDYVNANTAGVDDLLADVRAASWDEIVRASGIEREQIETAAAWARETGEIICSWCVGIAQQYNGPGNIQELLNLLLLRGAMAKPGAGACCVRGHSNVQGDRTMGVWERPQPELLDALQGAFGFDPPREHGLDSQKSIVAMHEGRVKVFISLGGNFLLALPDTAYAAEALSRTRLTVRIGTKLNRSDLVTGAQALILPCLGRTEADVSPATSSRPAIEQFVSCENSMGVIQWSRGRFAPASPQLMGETAIVCRMAAAVLGDRATVDWPAWAENYDHVRDGIAKVIPGCHDYNARVRHPGGFYLPNPPRENVYHTDTGKANFTVNPIPDHQLGPNQFAMTTVRSHDQYNTTIYGLHDRYRGLHNERRVVMLNRADLDEQGIAPHQLVDVTSHWNGQTRTACGFVAVEFPIPKRCAAMYYPEANVLIPVGSVEPLSNCPTSKCTIISVRPTT
ncbi:FdhF/YdeP family oxidoreductase [Lacipirellula parvula]|uniref:Molybdopterin oxidoreductase n=1 Tax=Lacipirellula parvula TaxID=2650471 RepID=A0A5K7XEL5_9BACT|nr:FdhF/YdeP family oxidoreductase [Lacipirellula parvula]BBO31439.1 molybdopterin oxidoreductase [Lacipirellula parvula]